MLSPFSIPGFISVSFLVKRLLSIWSNLDLGYLFMHLFVYFCCWVNGILVYFGCWLPVRRLARTHFPTLRLPLPLRSLPLHSCSFWVQVAHLPVFPLTACAYSVRSRKSVPTPFGFLTALRVCCFSHSALLCQKLYLNYLCKNSLIVTFKTFLPTEVAIMPDISPLTEWTC
jgi:hypothetical protein